MSITVYFILWLVLMSTFFRLTLPLTCQNLLEIDEADIQFNAYTPCSLPVQVFGPFKM
jgi:hypothetical protein